MLEIDRKERGDEAIIDELIKTTNMAQTEANMLTNSGQKSDGNYFQLVIYILPYIEIQIIH